MGSRFGFAAIVLSIIGLLIGCNSNFSYLHSGRPSSIEPEEPTPDIEGADLAGEAFHLSDYRGQVILLDFWGNW